MLQAQREHLHLSYIEANVDLHGGEQHSPSIPLKDWLRQPGIGHRSGEVGGSLGRVQSGVGEAAFCVSLAVDSIVCRRLNEAEEWTADGGGLGDGGKSAVTMSLPKSGRGRDGAGVGWAADAAISARSWNSRGLSWQAEEQNLRHVEGSEES